EAALLLVAGGATHRAVPGEAAIVEEAAAEFELDGGGGVVGGVGRCEIGGGPWLGRGRDGAGAGDEGDQRGAGECCCEEAAVAQGCFATMSFSLASALAETCRVCGPGFRGKTT